jgi:hypothetical protein
LNESTTLSIAVFCGWSWGSSIVCTVHSFFASQSLHNKKKKIEKKSGDVNYEAIFPLFFLLHKRVKPTPPPLPSLSPTRANSHPILPPLKTKAEGFIESLTLVFIGPLVLFSLYTPPTHPSGHPSTHSLNPPFNPSVCPGNV